VEGVGTVGWIGLRSFVGRSGIHALPLMVGLAWTGMLVEVGCQSIWEIGENRTGSVATQRRYPMGCLTYRLPFVWS
jgi:hypothetical protein